jgi:hypothetical protein
MATLATKYHFWNTSSIAFSARFVAANHFSAQLAFCRTASCLDENVIAEKAYLGGYIRLCPLTVVLSYGSTILLLWLVRILCLNCNQLLLYLLECGVRNHPSCVDDSVGPFYGFFQFV